MTINDQLGYIINGSNDVPSDKGMIDWISESVVDELINA